jgi:hypothetical protein
VSAIEKSWEIRFSVEFSDGDVFYCATAWDDEGRVICGWSAITMSDLFSLIAQSAEREQVGWVEDLADLGFEVIE